jgi:hypothetical protein
VYRESAILVTRLCPTDSGPQSFAARAPFIEMRGNDESEANNLLAVRPIDDRAPESIGPIEDQPKHGAYKARCPTNCKRQESQDKEAAGP